MDLPFLRIPPFPGHRAGRLASGPAEPSDLAAATELVELLRAERVGGSFWGAQPHLVEGTLVLAPCSALQGREMIAMAEAEGRLDSSVMLDPGDGGRPAPQVELLQGPVDPWNVAEAAADIWAGTDHELALVSSLARRPVRIIGRDQLANDDDLARKVRFVVGGHAYRCPFTEREIDPTEAVELLGEWRRLIDRNRDIAAVLGVATWKRPTVDPLLWDGSSGPRHSRRLPAPQEGTARLAAWRSRTPATVLRQLEQSERTQAEIEDGMIRGVGLGANCIPPLSIVVDHSGIYFDPSRPSDLEHILQTAEMDDRLLNRAARLREQVVAAGISKYGGGRNGASKLAGSRRILVVGQVEDDRSILSGGGGQSNLELLQRARSIESDAWLIYRPHPDVEAGHRKGHIPDGTALRYANEVERGGSVISLIESVDGVHCITSLAGFEALLRGKPVTTHGAPFYAGWGLTTELMECPKRRTRRRSLDELVAATLILYPRYFDPVTRLPCPPEVLLDRLASGAAKVSAPLAKVRALQGKVKVAARRLWEAAA